MNRNTYEEPTLSTTLTMIADHLEGDIDIYLIGGGAMMFYGLKPATKDIDIVFLDSKSLSKFIKAANKVGIKPTEDSGDEYTNIGATLIMRAESGIQLDLFNKVVCNALEVKDSVVSRANHHQDIGKLHVYLMSREDIVLFKGITEREADLEDIRILINTGINWKIVEEECLSQEGSGKWANLFLDKLSDLYQRYSIKIRLNKVKEHADSYVLHTGFEVFMGNREWMFKDLQRIVEEKAGYKASWTRLKLKELEREGFIESRKKGRYKLYKLKNS